MSSRVFSSEEEVFKLYKSDKKSNQIVIFENNVYDVKDYMPGHPGGGELIEEHLGKNIEEFLTKTESKIARKILDNYEIELKNFKQVCPIEMLDKLENPISIKSQVKKAG